MIEPVINYSRLTNAEITWAQNSAAGNIELNEISAPSGTASGRGIIYVRSSDSKLYYQDDSGTETDLTAAGSGAPAGAQYITLALNASLTAERVLVGTNNRITITDGGANGNATLNAPQDLHATATIQFGSATIQTLNAGTAIITSGTITGITDLAVADGGTGASTAANARTNLGLVIGTDVQAFDAQLSDIAAIAPAGSAFVGSNATNLILRTAAQTRGDLGLVIGTDVQAFDSDLSDIAALTQVGSAVIISNGTIWTRQSGAALRSSLGLGIGVDVQAYDAQLADVAGLTPTGSTFIVGDGTNFISHSAAAVRGDLGLVIGTNVQAWDNDLDDLAALTTTKGNLIVGNGTDWIAVGVGSNTQVLTADSAQTSGVKWAAAGGGTTNVFVTWIGAGEGAVPNTGGAVLGKFGTTYIVNTLDYDPTNKTKTSFYRAIPRFSTIATALVDIYWLAANGVTVGTSDNARWDIEIRPTTIDEVFDSTATPASATTSVTGTAFANGDLAITSATISSSGWSDADLLLINVERNPGHADDDLTGTASLIGIHFRMI